MFGEFMASQIVFANDRYISSNTTISTKENRYLYPNYLSAIDFDCKTFPNHKAWPITQHNLEVLKNIYQDKLVVLPTHWDNPDLSLTKLPCKGVKFICNDINILKLAYILFWIKSHSKADNIWSQRQQEIEELINLNHPNSTEFQNMLNFEFHNWKFLAYKNNFLKDGKLDLRFYMERHWDAYFKANLKRPVSSRIYFDIGQALHGDMSNVPMLENYLDVSLNRLRLQAYRCRNLDILKNYLGLTLNDLSSKDWIDVLHCWVEKEINHTV